MRKFSENSKLNADVILSIMQEKKPNQVEQVKIPKERIAKFFALGTPAQKMEDTIVKALEFYRKRQKDRSDNAAKGKVCLLRLRQLCRPPPLTLSPQTCCTG